MEQPYLFEKTTLFGAGEAGDEVLYGKDALLRDIREAAGGGSLAEALLDHMDEMADSIVNGINTKLAAGAGVGGDTVINLYAYPGGPQMDQVIVKSYNRGTRNGLK